MNKTIRELAELAAMQYPDGYPITIPYSDDFARKFAELIVNECMAIAREADEVNPFGAGFGFAIAKDIEERFKSK